MRVARCRGCRRLTYPAHFVCDDCGSRDFDSLEVSEGTLLTYTVLHVPPSGVVSPLRIGIVEFEGGVRALGQLAEPMEVGAKVRAEWTVVREVEGRIYEGFRFRPA